LALVRKELVRPDRSELTAGDAFRFRHILIRDAAYAALPKADRAALHERFADWLERTAGQRLAELEEIVGHHLEQAYRYRTELGETGPALESLAERAAQRLTAAGLRAFDRSDARAAVDLLGLADTLAGIDPTTLLALAEARRRTGLLDSAVEAATRAATVAAETDQPDLLLRARMRVLDIRSFREPSALQDLRLVAGEALATAGPTGNPTVLAEAWRHVATVAGGNCQWEESLHAAENGIDAARAAGDHRAVAALANHVVLALLMGPSRCGDAISRCNALLLERGTLDVRAWTLSVLACLLAMSKDHSGWEALLAESDELYGQMGDEIHRAICRYFAGYTYHHLGDTARAERALRQAFDTMQGIGDSYILATTAGSLAQVLVDQGRFEEAERMIEIGSVADRADIDAHVLVTVASGRLCVARGDGNGAEDLARVAETLVEKTDETVARADVACLVADVLTLQGRFEEAADAARRGIALFESKGAGVLARRARRRMKEALLLRPSV
jgi:tetratricopeptide (TPR) repeat protein